MKVLKIISIIILGLIAIEVIAGLLAPKKCHVERTVVINAPRALVFTHVNYWKNWQDWSPWAERDSTMLATVEGPDGQKESICKWVGDPKLTGSGEMISTGVIENKELKYHLHFSEHIESESEGYVKLADVDDGIQVTWAFYGETPFPRNVMMLLIDMDGMVGPDFERGLALLKDIVEKEATKIPGHRRIHYRSIAGTGPL